jgi:hypothetical protein
MPRRSWRKLRRALSHGFPNFVWEPSSAKLRFAFRTVAIGIIRASLATEFPERARPNRAWAREEQNADLDPLRRRADFKALLTELEGK